MINNCRIVTTKRDIVNVMRSFSYDLRNVLFNLIINNVEQKDRDLIESNLYWISKLTYKSNYGTYKKLKEIEYKDYLFPDVTKFSYKKGYYVKKYKMMIDVLIHMISLENKTFDVAEFNLFLNSMWMQNEIVKPLYKNKNSIYPYNMPAMKFNELLEFRNEFNKSNKIE